MDEVAFGRYRLIEVIGEGGMGKVYKAHDTVMRRDVAIKVLPPELATEPGYEERFRREAYTAARLTEPHIIPIHEAGEIDGRLYLVMPVIDGIDVHSLLRRDGPMSPQRAVQVIEQLAAALNAAHAAGLVHRDIKPSNALLTGDDFVYLIDFGIAHDAAATRLTSTGMMVGTLAYMAPERFTAGIADARSDVYALTCVLYECLTGDHPYPGDSMEQQIAGHLTLDPPKPSSVSPAIAAGFDEVIATGMAKKPDGRYQSARELATAARRALTEVPTPAHDPNTAATLLADPTQPAPAPARRSDQLPTPPAPEPVWQQSAEPTLPAAQQPPPGWPPVPQPRPANRQPPQIGTPKPRRGRHKVNRRTAIAVLAVPVVVCVAAVVFAAATLRLYLADRAAADARHAIVQTATNAVTTLWTYTPENVDTLADRASQYLGGDFEAQYRKFVDAIAAPNKQAQVTNTAQVVGAAVESLSGPEATAVIYVNTTSTTPQTRDKPSTKYLSYRVIMQKHDSRWLITKMTTITSMDVEPKKLPGAG